MKGSITLLMVMIVLGIGLALPSMAGSDATQTYVLTVESKKRAETFFSGWLSVNGKRLDLTARKTPFEFRCEAGEIIEGAFRADDPARPLKVKIVDYGYSRRKAGPKAWGTAIEFAWAQPGVGPRFLKLSEGQGQGAGE